MSDIRADENKNISCLGSSLSAILNRHETICKEEDIFCCDQMLNIACESVTGAIYSEISDNLNVLCENKNIEYIKVDMDEIKQEIKAEKVNGITGFLLHIDCRALDYSEIFRNTKTFQRQHFVQLLDVNKNNVLIHDHFIPTTPSKKFNGWICIDKNLESEMDIYRISGDKYKQLPSSDKNYMVQSAIENYRLSLSNIDPFTVFINNLIELKNCNNNLFLQKVLFEMATTIGVGGVYATRVYFIRIINQLYEYNKQQKLLFEKLLDEYIKLRLLLLKSSVRLRENDFDFIIRKIMLIKEIESNIFNQIESI